MCNAPFAFEYAGYVRAAVCVVAFTVAGLPAVRVRLHARGSMCWAGSL